MLRIILVNEITIFDFLFYRLIDSSVWVLATVPQVFYFLQRSFDFLLNMFHLSYGIMLGQRYDLSNYMVWAKNRKPAGMGRFREALGS